MNKSPEKDKGKVAYRGKNEIKQKENRRNMHNNKAEYEHNQTCINQQKSSKVYITVFERMKETFTEEYNLEYSGNDRINENKRKIPKRHLLTAIFLFTSTSAIED